jgi:hypothetical protein
VPALSSGKSASSRPKLDMLDAESTGMPASDQMEAVVDVLHAALSRNYPAMTKEELLDLIDLGNMTSLIKAAMRTSGLVGKGEGKA